MSRKTIKDRTSNKNIENNLEQCQLEINENRDDLAAWKSRQIVFVVVRMSSNSKTSDKTKKNFYKLNRLYRFVSR